MTMTGRCVSVLLAITALARATSYSFRPPESTAITETLTGVVPYEAWVAILSFASAVVMFGVLVHHDWSLFIGHLALVASYTIYALSITMAVICDGAPWAGLMPIVLVALLNCERLFSAGQRLGNR